MLMFKGWQSRIERPCFFFKKKKGGVEAREDVESNKSCGTVDTPTFNPVFFVLCIIGYYFFV